MGYQSFAEYCQVEYSEFDQEHRGGGSFGVGMMESQEAAGEYTDPAIPQVCFMQMLKSPRNYRLDFGNGVRWHTPATTGLIGPQPPNTVCQLDMDENHSIRALFIDVDVIETLLDQAGFRHDPIAELYSEMGGNDASREAFFRLWLSMNDDRLSASLAIDGALLTFLAHYLPDAKTTLSPAWEAGIENKRMRRVIDYIEANLSQQLLMSELAAVAHLSESHFARSFRATLGKTAHAYVTERRISRARALLAQTDLSITAIGFECGFGSSAHFSTRFRQSTGASPSEYRLDRVG